MRAGNIFGVKPYVLAAGSFKGEQIVFFIVSSYQYAQAVRGMVISAHFNIMPIAVIF